MPLALEQLAPKVLAFLAERHLATLTTLRADGSPHVVPVGFRYDPATRTAYLITLADSLKARHLAPGGRAVLCQVDGGRWLTLEGHGRVQAEPEAVSAAVAQYAQRYGQPGSPAGQRVAIEVSIERIMGRG